MKNPLDSINATILLGVGLVGVIVLIIRLVVI